jgi:hypothetical protein
MLYFILVIRVQLELTYFTHIICWGLPLFATFIPFINSSYGAPDGFNWCWVVDTSTTPAWGASVWYWISYYTWMWLSFATIVVLFGKMILQYRRGLHPQVKARFIIAIKGLIGYPVIIFVSWLPAAIIDFYTTYNVNGIEVEVSYETTYLTTQLSYPYMYLHRTITSDFISKSNYENYVPSPTLNRLIS